MEAITVKVSMNTQKKICHFFNYDLLLITVTTSLIMYVRHEKASFFHLVKRQITQIM